LIPRIILIYQKITFIDGPYGEINKSTITLKASASIVGSNVSIIASNDFFSVNDVGKFLRMAHNGIWRYGKIVGFANSKLVTCFAINGFVSTNPTLDFRLSCWNNVNGYPSMGVIFKGRLYCARSLKNKTSIWVSKLWMYNDFSPTSFHNSIDTVLYDNSISMHMPEGKEILWLGANKNQILVGAKEGIFSVLSLKEEEEISPFNYHALKVNNQRSSNIMISNDYITLYVDYYKRHINIVEILEDKFLYQQNITRKCQHLF
jgi:hypothetical protein